MNHYTSTANNIMQANEIRHQYEEAADLEGTIYDISSNKAFIERAIVSVTPVLGSNFDSEKEILTGSIQVNHLRMMAFAVLALSFYTLIAMAVTFLAKNSVAGIVSSFVVSYGEAYLPFGLMPRWNFFHMGQGIFYTSDDSFTQFILPNQIRTLNSPLNLMWLLVLMVLVISLLFYIVGNKQRN